LFPPPFPLPPPQAAWNMQPPRTSMMAQNASNFLRCSVPRPVAPSRIAGISKPKASTIPAGCSPEAGTRAAVGPLVLTVSIAEGTPLTIVAVPTEQAGAGLTAGVMLQENATVVQSNPFVGVIVTVDVVDEPAETDDGASADAASEKSAVRLIPFDVLLA
jgi:hypothetical protein